MELSLSQDDMQTLAKLVADELGEPLLYSVDAAAKLLDLSAPSVHRLVKEGKLRPFTGHGMTRTQFTRAELERFVDGKPAAGQYLRQAVDPDRTVRELLDIWSRMIPAS